MQVTNQQIAQAGLLQGKELEKVHLKLVQANERDFANFARNLQVMVSEWEQPEIGRYFVTVVRIRRKSGWNS